ncbi:MAG: LamG domain-containing protein [Anaerolineae bacterium]|nr:LamG domain-containing protein [Anaerolineae bacterium]
MSNTPIILGTGRIELKFFNSTSGQFTYRYQIRTDGIKFIHPKTQKLISAFELVEQQLANEPFGLKEASYAKLDLFLLNLGNHFTVTLTHEADQVTLTVTHPNPFGPGNDRVFKDLNLTFVESKSQDTTTLTVRGQVALNLFNNEIILEAELSPEAGLRFNYNRENNPSRLSLKNIGALELSRLSISQSALEALPPLVLFTFDEDSGNAIFDSALDVTQPINLTIEDEAAVERLDGGLRVTPKASSLIISAPIRKGTVNPVKRLVEACQKTDELTIEAWIRPANTTQEGPARIVTLSENTSRRNFTLGQGRSGLETFTADIYDVRLRTETTTLQGKPSTTTPTETLTTELSHVVFTRKSSGEACIYVNGVPRAEQLVAGSLANWKVDPFRLALANEVTGQRPWAGEYYHVAIYNQALDERQIAAKFAPEITAEGILILDDNFGILANKRIETSLDYSLAKGILSTRMDIAAEMGSQLRFNHLNLEWRKSSDELGWQLTGQGQLGLTILGQVLDFFSRPE